MEQMCSIRLHVYECWGYPCHPGGSYFMAHAPNGEAVHKGDGLKDCAAYLIDNYPPEVIPLHFWDFAGRPRPNASEEGPAPLAP